MTLRLPLRTLRVKGRTVASALLPLLLATGLGLCWAELQSAPPAAPPTLLVTGIEAPLSIWRDAAGVPQVLARHEGDAWFGLGFTQAQDRLGQLLWLRRQARGRSAEWLGEAGLPADRMARSLGLVQLAERDFETAGAAARRVLEAYSAGVNAWLEQIEGGFARAPHGLPLRQPLGAVNRMGRGGLRHPGQPLGAVNGLGGVRQLRQPLGAVNGWAGVREHPDGWTPVDSLAIAKLRAWQTGSALDELLVLEALVQAIGPGPARAFFPQDDVLPRPAPGGAARSEVLSKPNSAARQLLRVLNAAPDAKRNALRMDRAPLKRAGGIRATAAGSAAWVVDARRTRKGLPLLAAELRAAPQFPAPLYEARLQGGALNVAGATLPGVPVFWAGLNGRVAWAATHFPALTSDLVEETLSLAPPPRYRRGLRWRRLSQRRELIAVRGAVPAQEQVVWETQRGPLLHTLLGAGRPLSLRFSGQQVGGVDALLQLTHARSAADITRALRLHGEPLLAVAWLSSAGDAGVQVAGFAPQRQLPSGLQPVPAGNASFRWWGRLPAARLPAQRTGPAKPWIVVADGALQRSTAPDLEVLTAPGRRATRIEALLRAAAERGTLDLARLVEVQHDTHAADADALLRDALALTGPLTGAARRAARRLADWDRSTAPASRGARVYHHFLSLLAPALFEPTLGPELCDALLALHWGRPERWVAATLRAARHGGVAERPWTRPSFVTEVLIDSLHKVGRALPTGGIAAAGAGNWGRLRRLRFRPLWPGAWPAPTGLGPFPYGGDVRLWRGAPWPVNESDKAPWPVNGFDARSAPVYRFAVDAGRLDRALTALAPGQSGQPGHAHATDGIAGWRAGHPKPLSLHAAPPGEGARLRLQPTFRVD